MNFKIIDNLSYRDDELLRNSCIKGKLKFIKLLLKIKPDIDLSVWNDRPFCNACEFGHLHIAKYLLKIKKDINISIDNEYAFSYACKNGHFNIVKWLLLVKPNIDIEIDENWAFQWACKNNHVDICRLLHNLKPKLYILKTDDDQIIKWHIRENIKIINCVQIENNNLEFCPICHYAKANIITRCKHQYCFECLNYVYSSVKNMKCPLCRSYIKDCDELQIILHNN